MGRGATTEVVVPRVDAPEGGLDVPDSAGSVTRRLDGQTSRRLLAASHGAAPDRLLTRGTPPNLAVLAHHSVAILGPTLPSRSRPRRGRLTRRGGRGSRGPRRPPHDALERARERGRRPVASWRPHAPPPPAPRPPPRQRRILRGAGIWLHVDAGPHTERSGADSSPRHRMMAIDRANRMIWEAHTMSAPPAWSPPVMMRARRAARAPSTRRRDSLRRRRRSGDRLIGRHASARRRLGLEALLNWPGGRSGGSASPVRLRRKDTALPRPDRGGGRQFDALTAPRATSSCFRRGHGL